MIDGVKIKNLVIHKDDRGWLMEILRNDDEIFEKFGQVYVTTCNPGVAKAWHYHKKQTDFFTVVLGKAKIVLYDRRENSPTKGEVNEFIVGEDNPMLIKIPPEIVHGFTALENKVVFVLNCPTLPYNPDNPDEFRIPFNSKEIPYVWGVERGG